MDEQDKQKAFDDGLNAEELDLNLTLPSMPGFKVDKKNSPKKQNVIKGDLTLDLGEEQEQNENREPVAATNSQTNSQTRTLTHCPSCQAPVKPAAAICLACGFNLKTGEKTKLRTDDGTMPEMRMKEILAHKKAQMSASKSDNEPVQEKDAHLPQKIAPGQKIKIQSEVAKQVAEEHYRETIIVPGIASIVGLALCIVGIILIQRDASMQLSWRTAETVLGIVQSHTAVFSTWMFCGFIGMVAMVVIYGHSFEIKSGLLRLFAVMSNTYAAGLFGFVIFGMLSGGTMAFLGFSFSMGLEFFFFFLMSMWIFKFQDRDELQTFFLSSRILPYAALFLGFIPYTQRDMSEMSERAARQAKANMMGEAIRGHNVRLFYEMQRGSGMALAVKASNFARLVEQGYEPSFTSGPTELGAKAYHEAAFDWASKSVDQALLENKEVKQALVRGKKNMVKQLMKDQSMTMLSYLNENIYSTMEFRGSADPFIKPYIVLEKWDDVQEDANIAAIISDDICYELSAIHDIDVTYEIEKRPGYVVTDKPNHVGKRRIDQTQFPTYAHVNGDLYLPQRISWQIVYQKIRYDLRRQGKFIQDLSETNYVELPIDHAKLIASDMTFKPEQIKGLLDKLGMSVELGEVDHYVFKVQEK